MKCSGASAIPAAVVFVMSLVWSVPAHRWVPNRDKDAILISADESPCVTQVPGFEKGISASSPGRHSPSTPSGGAVVITHGLRTKRKIALTFDACSTGKPSLTIDAGPLHRFYVSKDVVARESYDGISVLPATSTMVLHKKGSGYIDWDKEKANKYTDGMADYIADKWLEAIQRWDRLADLMKGK